MNRRARRHSSIPRGYQINIRKREDRNYMPTPTLAAAIARYLAEVSSKKKGHASEKSLARIWLSTPLAAKRVDSVKAREIKDIKQGWEQDRAAATVVRRLAFLSHVYTTIQKEWGFDELANPVRLVARPRVNDARDRRFLDCIQLRGVSEDECPREEVTWIIQSTRSIEMPTILLIAKETGMRRSEVTYMRREHVDMRHGIVHVPTSKNGRSRDVPLTPIAKEALRRWCAGKPSRGRVFSITAESVTRAFIRARRRARARYEALCAKYQRRPNAEYFRNLRFHDTRHEGTSQLAPVYQEHELAKVQGNVDTRMLLRYYHPDAWYLAKKLSASPLAKRQRAMLRTGAVPAINAAYAHA